MFEKEITDNYLINKNNLLENIVSSVADLTVQFNDSYIFIDIWYKNEELLYLPKEQLLGKAVRDIFSNDYIPLFENAIKSVFNTGDCKVIEYYLDLKNGKRYFKAKISKIDDNNVIGFINDITEYKLYTEQIKKKEALIEPIINSTEDIIFSIDQYFKITTFNNSFKEKIYLFYKKNINIGEIVFDIPFFKDFKSSSFEEALKNISSGLKINNEISIFHEGKNYYFSSSINPIIYEDKIIGVSIFSKDITNKKEIELELIRQKENFENILDKLPIGIFQKDKYGNYIYVNKIALNHISKDYSDIIGKNSIETFKIDVGTIFTKSDKALREGKELFSVDEVSLPKQNQNNTYMIGKILLDYKDPINSDIIGFSIDITDKKNAELKLLEQKERFENVLDNLPIGVFELDKNNKFTLINSTIATLRKKDKKDFIGKSIYDIYPIDLAIEGDYANRNLRETRTPIFYEKELSLESGAKYYYIGKFLSNPNDPENTNILGYSIDITEERKASIELVNQKEKFEKLLENLPFGIFEKDKDGKFTYVNSVGAKYIGKDRDLIIGKKSHEIFDYQPDLGQSFEDGDKSLRDSNTGFEVKENIKYVENKPYYYLTGKVLIDKNNPLESNIIGYSIDITERRLAEQEVLKQKETFENVLNSLFIPIIQKDKNGVIKFVNNRFMEVIKLEKEEIIGKTDFDVLNKDEAEKIKKLDLEIRSKREEKTPLIEEIIINKYGESFNLLFGGDLIDKNDLDSDIINYTIDITDRKKAEIELVQQKEKFENVLNSLPIAIFEKNIEGKYSFVNDQFAKLRGISRQDFIDKKVQEIFTMDIAQDLDSTDEYVFKTGNKHSVEKKFIVNNELKDFLVEKNISNTSNNEQTLIGYALDITEKKKAEVAILKAVETAEKTALAKSEFLSIMSHEIRTPINAVIGVTNLLFENNPRENQMNNLEILKLSSQNLLLLINDILDFSKIEARKISLERIDFSLKNVVFEVKEMFKARNNSKNIDLIIDYDENIPPMLEGDPTRLSQIINNLVSNSIKFTESGYVKIVCKLNKLIDNNADIYISIEDTGIGISKDRIDTIFEIFTQENTSTTRKYGGTGLGLNIVKSLLALYNSEIYVQSEKDKGSKFYFNLNLSSAISKSSNVEKKPITIEKDLSGIHILIVEDNKVNAIVVKQFLKKWNAVCDIAEDGLEALEFLKEKETDLILMDIQMPNMDGLEATRNIRKNKDTKYSYLPIIALTAATTMDILDKVYEVGMNDYVSKPFNPENLYLKIKEQLKNKKAL